MQSFIDKNGTSWPIELTSGDVFRVRDASRPEVEDFPPGTVFTPEMFAPRFNLLDSKISEKLHLDLGEFYELLVLLLDPIIEERGLTALQFGKLISGSSLYIAQAAFFREWHDFFLQLQRLNDAAALEKLVKYQAKAMELLKAKISSKEMAEVDSAVELQMQKVLNDSFGNLRESLGLPPGPTPSDS